MTILTLLLLAATAGCVRGFLREAGLLRWLALLAAVSCAVTLWAMWRGV